jgi:hypothetical protein
VWTAKRILLLTAGFGALVVVYAAYAFFLPVDGLPQLPDKYRKGPEWDSVSNAHPARRDRLVEKLRQAFGENAPEATNKYPIKIELRARGIILAAGDFNFEHDQEGRVRFSPVSIAIFGKTPPGSNKFPEINTVRAEVAYLTFDKPIYSAAEMNSRKIVKGELVGGGSLHPIEIVNNRRTTRTDDDIVVTIDNGPLYYLENEQRMWTDKWVQLKDYQSKPEPVTIKAEGMDLYLAVNHDEPKPGDKTPPKKPKNETISGVERIVLRSWVHMVLFSDPRTGFMAGNSEEARSQPPSSNRVGDSSSTSSDQPAVADKAKIDITTQGPFHYDVASDFAQFDIPLPTKEVPSPPQILVMRGRLPLDNSDTEYQADDQMVCDHLDLQFHRRAPSKGQPAKEDRTPDLEIERVVAWGKQVVVISGPEHLESHSTDLVYDAPARKTVLRFDPKKVVPDENGRKATDLWVLKDGNEIHAQYLELINQKDSQEATSTGPGYMLLFDKSSDNRVQAVWKRSFHWSRDAKSELLTLNGDAVFDDGKDQHLQADELKVWLLPAEQKQATQTTTSQTTPGGRRPEHVEATGNVFAKSPEMYIHDTKKLIVHVKDVPAKSALSVVGKASQAPGGSWPPSSKLDAPKPTGPGAPPAEQAKPPANPIDLSAKSVEVSVLRDGQKSELDELRCAKSVHVVQRPATPEEKGVDITGDKLHLTHFPEGNQLVVTGGMKGGDDLAQLRLDKIYIVGPAVNIDQAANKAWVNGIGLMQIESDTDFQGKKLAKSAPLTIYWNKRMMFNGPDAEFHGDIQATQQQSDNEYARLMCQVLQVYFDKPISLKEGDKGAQPARVKHLVCDQKVNLHDEVFEGNKDERVESKKLIKDQRLECTELVVDNEANTATAYGPKGVVRIFQAAESNLLAPAAPVGGQRSAPAGKSEETKLTYVTYAGKMFAENNKKTARFYDDVKLLHVPTKDPNLKVDLDKMVDELPQGGLYMESAQLRVTSRTDEKTKQTSQEMEANGKVFIKAQDFYGRADSVTYDESKNEQIILNGGKGNAHLYRARTKGLSWEEFEAKQIIYIRKTGEVSVDGGQSFKGRN